VGGEVRILSVSGSLRKESFNTRLLAAVPPLAPAGMTFEVFDGLVDLPPFNEDLDTPDGGPAPVRAWRDAVRAADALLIVTPEYNGSIPGLIKNAVDWVSVPTGDAAVHGKIAMIMAATTGRGLGRSALSDLARVLYECHAHVISGPWVVVTEAGAEGTFVDAEDDRGRLVPTVRDRVTVRMAKAQLRALAAAIDAGAGRNAVVPLRELMGGGRNAHS
jgi:chromate reductase